MPETIPNGPELETDDQPEVQIPTTLTVTEQERKGFYLKMRQRIEDWAHSKTGRANRWLDVVLLAPDFFHLLCKLVTDPDVPATQKAKAGALIAYYISPLDFMPEAIMGPFGYADDVALAAWFVNQLVNKIDPALVARHWAGSSDMLKQVHHIAEVGDEMLGGGMWKRVLKWFDDKGEKGNQP